eukprot:gnl/Spiro4/9313_TR4906_c0_g1_i1.p1 gnl/Spiro4/9313_TR4906_c0_g1~~gnl/Spiro4/9313_TR4906_c0_g1_i1.p1  ORF type:complete len:210 (-),score=46.40 gnl/Spiro4/9313_TR4906_c0_g1_i1:72-671(-)
MQVRLVGPLFVALVVAAASPFLLCDARVHRRRSTYPGTSSLSSCLARAVDSAKVASAATTTTKSRSGRMTLANCPDLIGRNAFLVLQYPSKIAHNNKFFHEDALEQCVATHRVPSAASLLPLLHLVAEQDAVHEVCAQAVTRASPSSLVQASRTFEWGAPLPVGSGSSRGGLYREGDGWVANARERPNLYYYPSTETVE